MMHEPNCNCSRRQMIRSLVGGSLLMPAILSELMAAEAGPAAAADPMLPRTPHFTPKAKRVIFLYMSGGVSHVDTFDLKPKLRADHGKALSPGRYVKGYLWDFKPRGKCGTEISELLPHIAGCADDLCVIRSMHGDAGDHFEATLGIHTGSTTVPRPSMGSWVSYGLGTFNQNLPSYAVLAPELPYAGGQLWSSNFLPACHQGIRIIPGDEPIPNMRRRTASAELQEMELGLLASFNRKHLKQREPDPVLAGRIRSFETAAGMQREAPEVFDLSKESDATFALYGLERGSTAGFAWQCLVGRRLAERGVRFIELIDSGANGNINWDAHNDMERIVPLAKNVDQPIAALLKDLKSRGMLDDTLVVWTTEFGRSPCVDSPQHKGREHHARCYSSWLAGAGVKPGITYGKSDDYGNEVAEKQVHVHDFHATILHLLGLNHEKLTYRYAGRDFRLTDVHGNVVHDILA